MAKNEIQILVTAEVNKALKNIKKVEKQTKKTAKSAGNALGKLKVAYLAIGAGIFVAIRSISKFVNAAAIQEKEEKTLDAAMKQAGTFTKAAFKENLKYAASLQKMTIFGDEAILGVQKMLTNFGIEKEALKGLTEATLDLAAAKGMDLKAAADLVAKSVGSSTNALTRYGIEVKGAVGSTERAETAIKNITKLFGGAAQAEAKTYSGVVEQTKNVLGDLAEKIGFKLFPVLKPFLKIITNLVTEDDDLKTLTQDLIKLQDEHAGVLKKLSSSAFDASTATGKLVVVNEKLLKLKIAEKIDDINDRYEEITKTGFILKGELQKLNEEIKFEEANLERVGRSLSFLKEGSFGYNNTIRVQGDLLKIINKLETKKAALNKELTEGQIILKNALDKGLITDRQRKVLNEELLKAARELKVAKDEETDADEDSIAPKEKIIVLTAAQAKALENLKIKALEMGIAETELTNLTIDQVRKRIEAFQQEKEIRDLLIRSGFDLAVETSNLIFALNKQNREADLINANEYTLQLAELDKIDTENKKAKLREELDAAILAGDTELANEKELALKRIDLLEKQKVKEAQIKSAAAKKQRKADTVQAVVNTALAVGNALATTKPFIPAGIAAGILALAKGSAEVATIRGQPVPSFAEGGISDGGLALVGERGAELVNLPRGANVSTANETSKILNNRFNVENITLPNVKNGEEFYNELQNVQRRYGALNFEN